MDDFTEAEPPKPTLAVGCSAVVAGANLVLALLLSVFAGVVVVANSTESTSAHDYEAALAFLGILATWAVCVISMSISAAMLAAGQRSVSPAAIVMSKTSLLLGAASFGMAVWQLMFRNG